LISASKIVKRYGEFSALDDVSIDVPAGSLTALLGIGTLLSMNILNRRQRGT